ncbi:MAG: phosphoribosylamine--glycine ligase [Campylobacterales bacterium]|nr:phosphoribosylamine--glycine ligase [Campylobacterales bacterium]
MKILIIGSGGREYSIGRRLSQDEKTSELFFAPGNGATENLGTNLAISDYEELANYAVENGIELTIVGPEDPLTKGAVDLFRKKGLAVFGPTQAAARLEESKVYMKNFLRKYEIPTAKYVETSDLAEAENFIDTLETPIVVKADGLCAGKGVIIATSHQEAKDTAKDMLSGSMFGDAGAKVVVEEFLDGFELSVFGICDGKDFITLPACQDHKRLLDNDEGPNTGGMGAYCPAPMADDVLMKKIEDRIIRPTMEGMIKEGAPFEGVLFCGIMVVNNEPITLEFNVRFGDPECEVLMPLLKSSPVDLFYKASTGKLGELNVEFHNKKGLCVVMASENYPYKSSTPAKITVPTEYEEDAHISFAGVKKEDEDLMATGGRVLLSVAIDEDIKKACEKAYRLCQNIKFDGSQYRKDIAWQVVGR